MWIETDPITAVSGTHQLAPICPRDNVDTTVNGLFCGDLSCPSVGASGHVLLRPSNRT